MFGQDVHQDMPMMGWFLPQVKELEGKFSLERVTKSAAVFDKVKLSWLNGQHLRAYGEEELASMVGSWMQDRGLVKDHTSAFSRAVVKLSANSLELVNDIERELDSLVSYPLEETLASDKCAAIVEDNFKEVVDSVVAKYDSGELEAAVSDGTMK
eukprot:scaffold368741_cov33-Prasinocladus_malaysianus.AAC.1